MFVSHMLASVSGRNEVPAGPGSLDGFHGQRLLVDLDTAQGAQDHSEKFVIDDQLLFADRQSELHQPGRIVYEVSSGESDQQITDRGLVAALGVQGLCVADAGCRVVGDAVVAGELRSRRIDEAALDGKIAELIKQVKRGAPNAVAMVKQALRTGDEVKAFADCFAHADAEEGMTAFIDKRKARWMEG